MQLVEKHNLTRADKYFHNVDSMAFLCKNLYNATLYAVRQHFFQTGKILCYPELQKQFQQDNQPDYRALPAKISQWVMKMVDQNFKSFFKALKQYKNDPSKFNGRPKLPKYLDKNKGRFLITFTNQAISKPALNNAHLLKPSGLELYVHTTLTYHQIQQVRIVNNINGYTVEIIYNVPDVELLPDNGTYAAIDMGVNNLATVVNNNPKIKPYVISGRELKSINHRYNKEKARLQTVLETRNKAKSSKQIKQLTYKRNNRVNDRMHKATRYIVNQLVSTGTHVLIVGKNTGWKQDINIGKVNNQGFVEIPHARFIDMLIYKCRLVGISVIVQEESYTSKCSFLDGEEICKHDAYCGSRVKRGLFKSASGRYINADVNGAYNIMRKCKPNAINSNGISGVVVHPAVVKIAN